MKKMIVNALVQLSQIFRIRKIILAVNQGENDLECRSLTIAHSSSMFSPTAVIRNPQRRKESIVVGENTLVDGELLIHDYGGKIEIGSQTYIGKGSRIWSGESVKIGKRVFVAHNCTITDGNSHQYSAKERAEDYQRRIVEGKPFEKGTIETQPTTIEDDAWINFGVGILKGVTVGQGAIVASGSLVTKDVPPWTLVAGIPAKVIRPVQER